MRLVPLTEKLFTCPLEQNAEDDTNNVTQEAINNALQIVPTAFIILRSPFEKMFAMPNYQKDGRGASVYQYCGRRNEK